MWAKSTSFKIVQYTSETWFPFIPETPTNSWFGKAHSHCYSLDRPTGLPMPKHEKQLKTFSLIDSDSENTKKITTVKHTGLQLHKLIFWQYYASFTAKQDEMII